MPARANIDIYQSDSFTLGVQVRNSNGTPADITGYTAIAQIRRASADADPVIAAEFTCAVTSPLVNISLTPEQTRTLRGQYVWDLQITSPAEVVTTILAGRVRVTAEVSRAIAA